IPARDRRRLLRSVPRTSARTAAMATTEVDRPRIRVPAHRTPRAATVGCAPRCGADREESVRDYALRSLRERRAMNYWLMKSEPSTFSIDHLARAKNQTTGWDGVRNYQARNFLKEMKKGDLAFFYHSSCAVPGIAGIVSIVREAYPDRNAFDPKDDHYDA